MTDFDLVFGQPVLQIRWSRFITPGNLCFGDTQLQLIDDLIPMLIQFALAGSFGSAQELAFGSFRFQSLFCSFGNEMMFQIRE